MNSAGKRLKNIRQDGRGLKRASRNASVGQPLPEPAKPNCRAKARSGEAAQKLKQLGEFHLNGTPDNLIPLGAPRLHLSFKKLTKVGRGRGTVGKCTGPKWSKRPLWSKWPYSELDFSIHETKMDQKGLKRPILVHLGPPTVLGPFLTKGKCIKKFLGEIHSITI